MKSNGTVDRHVVANRSARRGLASIAALAAVAIVLISAADASAATRRTLVTVDPFGYRGGGVYLMNRPGHYYMGRLNFGVGERIDVNRFDAHTSSAYTPQTYPASTTGTYTASNSGKYRWGNPEYSKFGIGSCIWAGPNAGGSNNPSSEYLQSGGSSVSDRCTAAAGQQSKMSWLDNPFNWGRTFNCQPGGGSSGGMPVQLTAASDFYYNVGWKASGNGTSLIPAATSNLAGSLPSGTWVRYRFTLTQTTGGYTYGAVFHPGGYGWGFVRLTSLPSVRTGYWQEQGDDNGNGTSNEILPCSSTLRAPDGTGDLMYRGEMEGTVKEPKNWQPPADYQKLYREIQVTSQPSV